MPRFFFHIRAPAGLIRDTKGLEIATLRPAIEEAQASAESLRGRRKYMPGRCHIEVCDEAGLILAVVPIFLAREFPRVSS